jgi:hypothetical protein
MRNVTVVILLFATSVLCFGQVPKATIYNPNTELYVGYSLTFPDFGPRYNSYRFNGAEVAFAKYLTPHFALVASGNAVFGSVYQVKQYAWDVGAKYNLTFGRFRPFGQVRYGFAYQASNGMYAGDHHPPLSAGANDVEDGVTYRVGAGGDLQLTNKVYWRMLQWDVEPEPWARHTPFYQSWGSGVGYRF